MTTEQRNENEEYLPGADLSGTIPLLLKDSRLESLPEGHLTIEK